jgi:hypothetical protein
MEIIVLHVFYKGNESGERGANALKKLIEEMGKRENKTMVVEISRMNVPDSLMGLEES